MAGKMTNYKLVVLGLTKRQMCLNHFVETYDPTIEDSYRKQVVFDGQASTLEVIDTAGQEEYASLRDQWIREGEAFLVVYSVTSRESFKTVQTFYNLINRVKENSASTHNTFSSALDVAVSLGSAPIMLVGNKTDRVTEREVSTVEGSALARNLGVDFLEVSSKTSFNVEKAFYDLIRVLRRQRHQYGVRPYPTQKTFWGSRRVAIPPNESETEAGRRRLLTSLIRAAKFNNEKDILAYLNAGADINAHLGSDGSALHASAAAGHANIVNILLIRGAAVNALSPTGIAPLQIAAAEGHLAVVRLMVHKGANINQTSRLHGTALGAAASRGRANIVQFLLKKGANVHIKGGPYGNVLQAASWNGNSSIVKYLLDAGADIRARGDGDCTALQMAAFVGKAEVIRVLLDRGAAIDIDAPGGKYGTALKAANDGGHFDAVQILLAAGASSLGLTPLPTSNNEELPADSQPREQTTNENKPEYQQECHAETAQDRPDSWQQSPGLETQDSVRQSVQNVTHHVRPKVNPLGFSVLHNPPNAEVDVVFVHGLQGNPEMTWTYSGPAVKSSLMQRIFASSSKLSLSSCTSPVYWPYDLLAKCPDFAEVRILTWGYDTKVIREFFGTSDKQNISQHGNNLMALDNSKRSSHQPQYLSIYASTKGIVFLGTPHRGSEAASWGVIASNTTKLALQGPSERVLRGLKPNNELLENLRKTFLQMLEDGHFNIHSFYETHPIMGMYGLNSLIVPYSSALVGHARKEVSLGLPGNHSEICKFSGADDPGYKAVFGALQDYIRKAKAGGRERATDGRVDARSTSNDAPEGYTSDDRTVR
ncbi:hypothetical protein DL766_005571 [Monosporascus sp. MC13-8B]|uniref:Ras-domain-containing protein n=1 Tax=Monosporascus cannonballus TaxID=155416 RepID=A0ABY0H9G9_9PEZI|nr:hypothetical protein DL762_005360 [Monosporascus cannonballus]RYO99818.1 hypothetical protein DL763_001208 [Monosporascus cannonballus]RYP29005.1 hypothetical protein DL766_005571 [Monosporascus sp. MC13-8B]